MPTLRTTLIIPLALCALLGAGCSSKPAAPAETPVAAPITTTVSAPASPTASASPTATVSATAATTPPMNEVRPVRLEGVAISPTGTGFQVRGRLLDDSRQPIIGAVGDFYLEGAARNLVQSYATGVDGGFSASFRTDEVPPEATLMMHYRGNGSQAATSFLIRKGIPRPTPTQPARTTATAPTPSPAAPQPAPRFAGPAGSEAPLVTVAGGRMTVIGRLLGADGRPLAEASVTAPGMPMPVRTGPDGDFLITLAVPTGARELIVSSPAAMGRPEATVKVIW